MTPDLAMLRDLVESTPEIRRWPGDGASESWVRAAEARVGRLPASYRWWLTEARTSRVGHVDVASLADPEHVTEADDALTAGWRLAAGRLCFASEPDGAETFSFALDRTSASGEHPVVRVDGIDGSEEVVAETFAGFVSVQVALLRGLGDGPNPVIAELWRSTPGVLRPDGITVHGPHRFAEVDEAHDVAETFAGFVSVQVALLRGLGDGPNPTIAETWRSTPGVRRPDGFTVHGPHRFAEANEAHDIADLAPHWVLVGEDGEGAGLFMRRHGRDRTSVHRLDLSAFARSRPGEGGSRIEAEGELVTTDLLGLLGGDPAA